MSEDATVPSGSGRRRDSGVAVVGAPAGSAPPASASPSPAATGLPRSRAQQVRRRPAQVRGRRTGRGGAGFRVTTADDLDVGEDHGASGAGSGTEAATDAATDAPTDAEREGRGAWTPPRRRRGARRPGTVPTRLAVALGAVAALATAAAVVFGVDWAGLNGQAQQSATVKHVAKIFLDDLTNFKPTTVDADFGALLSFATGDFARQANQFFGSNIRQELEQAQAQSDGQVRDLYVQSLSGPGAEVYAVVDQTYLNDSITKAGGQPVPDVLRVVLGLTQASGSWKISEVSVLQAPSSSSTGATVP